MPRKWRNKRCWMYSNNQAANEQHLCDWTHKRAYGKSITMAFSSRNWCCFTSGFQVLWKSRSHLNLPYKAIILHTVAMRHILHILGRMSLCDILSSVIIFPHARRVVASTCSSQLSLTTWAETRYLGMLACWDYGVLDDDLVINYAENFKRSPPDI